MTKIPILLILIRLLIGLLLIPVSYFHIDNYKLIAIVLFTIGLFTDIFDGIIARKLNVSTVKLRRLDSTIDLIFFVSIGIATFFQCPTFFFDNFNPLLLLILFELTTYLICFLKFRKEIATHTIGAKIWTLLLFATLVEIILQCNSGLLFTIFFWIGIVTRLEITLIILILKNWTHDVPTVWHALQLRKGKVIRRNKIFNG